MSQEAEIEIINGEDGVSISCKRYETALAVLPATVAGIDVGENIENLLNALKATCTKVDWDKAVSYQDIRSPGET